MLVASVAGVGLLADRIARRQSHLAQKAQRQALTEMFAAALAAALERDEPGADQVFARVCSGVRGLYAAEWSLPGGAVRCRWPGGVVPASGGASASAPIGLAQRAPPAGELAVFSTPITVPHAPAAGTLRLTFAGRAAAGLGYWLLSACAAVSAAALLAYWVIYRRIRRHLRPVDAIQRNLCSYAAGLERDLAALSLSDSLGQVAQAWNRLIEQVCALPETQAETGQPDPAGDALRRFESRTLRATLDRLPIGLLRFGADQRVTYANAAAARLLDRPVEALVGMPLGEALEEEVRAPLVGAYLRSATPTAIDRKRGDGDQRVTLRFALLPPSTAPAETEAVLTIEDVTHLREADRTRDNFLYHVTHELRTPLTNIQAYAETLTGPGFDDEQTRRECYNVIISETRRLSRLVEDILSISQLEVGTARMELTTVDLVRLLRQIVQDHLGAADEKRIELTLRLAPKVPKVRGDKQRLSVLFTNLIGNALKYTPEGGRVDVTLEVTERSVQIAISDTGIGIAPEDQAHVFEKFYRANNPEVQTITGTGLGLALAREVARLHGGDIRLESELGKGSTFVVELPAEAGEA